MKVLVTGGAGYIGSHTCAILAGQGFDVTIYDNLSSGSPSIVERLAVVAGRQVEMVVGDLLDAELLSRVVQAGSFDAVIHFAGLKSISESLADPLAYYKTNVVGTLNLLDAMKTTSTRALVFSSSASVYGNSLSCPVGENAAVAPTNPYAKSKSMVEHILEGLQAADSTWRFSALRYFNPVGAHTSGLLGETMLHSASNLLPVALSVARGQSTELRIYGDDYPTPDGTGVRDYVHVMDLAEGHLSALRYLQGTATANMLTLNLGTGHGVSVLQMVKAIKRASGASIPLRIVPRRAGDVGSCYANVELAEAILGWKATRSIDEMCADAWRWVTRGAHAPDLR